MDGRTSNLTLTDLTVWWLKVAAVAAAWHSLHIWHSLALFCSWQRGCHPHQHITGHSQAQTAASTATPSHLRVLLPLHLGSPRPPLLPRQGRVPGLSSATQLARGRGRSKERPTPTSPLQEQLKMKHTRLHSSARIRSRHPHPPLPALEMPPGPPSIPRPRHPRSRLSPRQKLIGKLGGRKRLHPLPYLPVERRSGKGSSEGKRQLPAGPAARIAQGCGGRGAGGRGGETI